VGCSLEKKPSFKEEKLAFEHKNGEKEQPQPQLYGTSYLLVKITLLGQLFSSHRVPRRAVRTREQKEARKHVATQVREQLRLVGVQGALEMIIDHEHSCGCPLLLGSWKCAHCSPLTWGQDVDALIDTILEE